VTDWTGNGATLPTETLAIPVLPGLRCSPPARHAATRQILLFHPAGIPDPASSHPARQAPAPPETGKHPGSQSRNVADPGAPQITHRYIYFAGTLQAGRAIVAASPRLDNQAWKVSGHGLTASTNAANVADVIVTATRVGLFPAVASALDVEALVPGEPVSLRELWPLLPETAGVPLTADAMFPALLFFQDEWPTTGAFAHAEVSWIPRQVQVLYGQDRVRVKEHLDRYPALRGSLLRVSHPMGGLDWSSAGPGMTLNVEWRSGSPPLMLADYKTLSDLGVACYRSADDSFVTPAIGSMATGLHPFLALWAVLLALSSLARYEPATWTKMINIDRSAEANAIEHLLEEVIASIPATVLHLLTTFR
jgi:hypothetical protein